MKEVFEKLAEKNPEQCLQALKDYYASQYEQKKTDVELRQKELAAKEIRHEREWEAKQAAAKNKAIALAILVLTAGILTGIWIIRYFHH